jgi:hypothetical protein
VPALHVGDQQLRTRIANAVFELRPRPPGIERYRDRAEAGDREESNDELRQVSHRHRDPVALADVAIGERLSKRRNRAILRVEADAVVFQNRRHPPAMGPADLDQRTQVRRGIFPDPSRDAANRNALHFESLARRAQQGLDLFQRKTRPCRSVWRSHPALLVVRSPEKPRFSAGYC